jgi:protein SCO1/2
MAAAIDQLGPAGDRVQPIFITIDPGRDTVQRLAEYAPLFHPRLLALTGTPDEIARAAEQYRVYYEKAGEGTDYLMNHSGIVYLMDPEGRFLTHFAQGTPPEEMALKIRSQMSESRNQNS